MNKWFQRFADVVSRSVGSPNAFLIALFLVIAWAISGPLFDFSAEWQLVINTATTIITFLMVFLIQATQNRDAVAMNLKLDELVRSHHEAHNELVGLERADDETLKRVMARLEQLGE